MTNTVNSITTIDGTYGAAIRCLRREKKIGLREFARRAGITPTVLSKIERGLFAPPDYQVIAITKAMKAMKAMSD